MSLGILLVFSVIAAIIRFNVLEFIFTSKMDCCSVFTISKVCLQCGHSILTRFLLDIISASIKTDFRFQYHIAILNEYGKISCDEAFWNREAFPGMTFQEFFLNDVSTDSQSSKFIDGCEFMDDFNEEEFKSQPYDFGDIPL